MGTSHQPGGDFASQRAQLLLLQPEPWARSGFPESLPSCLYLAPQSSRSLVETLVSVWTKAEAAWQTTT